jgi:hypothetical protein
MHVEYELRPDGIYHISFLKSSRQAADEFCNLYYNILVNHPEDRPFRVIMDFTPDGLPNVAYLFQQITDLYRDIGRDNVPYKRVAFLLTDAAMIPILRPFLELLRTQARRKFVVDGDMEEAVDWLMHQETRPTRPRQIDTPS